MNIAIDKSNIELILVKIEPGLKKYKYIMENFNNTDISIDAELQKKFTGFYKVRRNKEFLDMYYKYMESNKYNENITFEDTLKYIYSQVNRIEPSFSSKLVATINPNMPIWDSIVLDNLNLKAPQSYKSDDYRIEKIIRIYNQIVEYYEKALHDNRIEKLILMFDHMYPDANISKHKKLDFILWKNR